MENVSLVYLHMIQCIADVGVQNHCRYKSTRCELVETVPLLGPNMLAYFELCHIRACFASKDDMIKVSWLMLNGVLPATDTCVNAGNGQGRSGHLADHTTEDHREELLEAWSLYFSPAAAPAGAARADGGAAVYDGAAPE